MTYQLPPDLDQRVQSQIALGIYNSPAEVLNDALNALDERNIERRAIQEGIDAWRAGDVQDFDQFDAEFRATNGIQ
jgi:plasmid stabilization system protein ParE/Arc/MetJ-type ribon-helix-helix transcriptional regulator